MHLPSILALFVIPLATQALFFTAYYSHDCTTGAGNAMRLSSVETRRKDFSSHDNEPIRIIHRECIKTRDRNSFILTLDDGDVYPNNITDIKVQIFYRERCVGRNENHRQEEFWNPQIQDEAFWTVPGKCHDYVYKGDPWVDGGPMKSVRVEIDGIPWDKHKTWEYDSDDKTWGLEGWDWSLDIDKDNNLDAGS